MTRPAKGLMFLMFAVVLVLGTAATAVAGVTLWFDPNDVLDKYPADSSGLKATQPDARRVHAIWGSPYYGTFSDAMQSGHTQPSDYNTYMNWRASLDDAGEGIAMFNSWFLDLPAARSWGETVVIKPGTVVSGTSASGWSVRVIDSPYGLGGSSVQWWTTDSTKRLRPTGLGGPDIGLFSITADLYYDLTGDGWTADDVAVVPGNSVRFWVGNLNGDDAEFYRSDTQALYFGGDDFGTTTPNYGSFTAAYGSAAYDYGSGFEGVLEATAVPEPAFPALVAGALVAFGAFAGRRRPE